MNSKGIQAERLNELLGLLGIGPVQLASILQVSTSAISQWRNSKTVPDRNALVAMASRWHISVDGLIGLPGTDHLEPSPSLRLAQDLVRAEIVRRGPDSGKRVERLALLYHLFTEHLPELTRESWAEYLQCDTDRWIAIKSGFREPADSQFQGAAFFAGWYTLASAWESWLTLGDIGPLIGPSRATTERLHRILDAKGGGPSHILKAIKDLENK